jgi:hypothetical protein
MHEFGGSCTADPLKVHLLDFLIINSCLRNGEAQGILGHCSATENHARALIFLIVASNPSAAENAVQ